MKTFFLILFFASISNAQSISEMVITEGESREIAGKKIDLVSIEYSVSKMFARVLIDDKEKLFIEGDELFPGDDSVFFVNRIQKSGRRARGEVIIDKVKELFSKPEYESIVRILSDTIFTIGNSQVSINPESDMLKIRASSTRILFTINELFPEIDDEIWFGSVVYRVSDVDESNGILNSLTLLKLSDARAGYDLPLTFDSIDDDLSEKENLLIRKINYSPTKRPGNEKLTICLIKLIREVDINVAMPVLPVEVNGVTHYYPFNVIRFFDTEEEAIKFAIEKDIVNIELE